MSITGKHIYKDLEEYLIAEKALQEAPEVKEHELGLYNSLLKEKNNGANAYEINAAAEIISHKMAIEDYDRGIEDLKDRLLGLTEIIKSYIKSLNGGRIYGHFKLPEDEEGSERIYTFFIEDGELKHD